MVQNAATLAIFGIIPFNLIKCSINSLGAMVLYKRISPLLHGYGYTTYPAAKPNEA
jgi:riboflavin transporter FmnP